MHKMQLSLTSGISILKLAITMMMVVATESTYYVLGNMQSLVHMSAPLVLTAM